MYYNDIINYFCLGENVFFVDKMYSVLVEVVYLGVLLFLFDKFFMVLLFYESILFFIFYDENRIM